MSFKTDLWDGFDAVCTHMNQAKHTAKHQIGFFESVSKIEQKYAQDLQALCQRYNVQDPMNTANAAWVAFKTQIQRMGDEHATLATELFDNGVRSYQQWRSSYKKIIRDFEADGSKYRRDYGNAAALWKKFHEAYQRRCAEADKAHQDTESAGSDRLRKAKAQEREKQCLQLGLKADEDYKSSVLNLRTHRDTHDTAFQKMLNEMQQTENSRLAYLKMTLQRVQLSVHNACSNVMASVMAGDQAVAKMDSDSDMKSFIASKKSGVAPPAQVEYEPLTWIGTKQQPVYFDTDSPVLCEHSPMPHSLHPDADIGRSRTQSNVSTRSAMSTLSTQSRATAGSKGSGLRSTQGERYVAAYDYTAGDPTELSLIAGEIVYITVKSDENWWLGERERDGKKGMVPATYIVADNMPHVVPAAAAVESVAVPAGGGADAIGSCTALYDYQAADTGEISITEGELIHVLAPDNDGWTYGTNSSGETGLFPTSYVTMN
eukprot:TRINITY_DN13611_c0_g1_i1.p1 TRINITY_DN13611_c0_g1~~TRINITY_DN13611_c0_g1_i1.p1  ORF type:complete len:488 (+),score=103.72 TRINITY_DN13611_c0_g1_i1:94-1557(+)